jgi:hypothetical protein
VSGKNLNWRATARIRTIGGSASVDSLAVTWFNESETVHCRTPKLVVLALND